MLFGSLILIKTPWPGAHIHLGVSLSVTLPLAFIIIVLLRAAILASRRKAVTGAEGLMDALGVARTDLVPLGKIVVHGEIWDARAKDTSQVTAGRRVRVCGMEGLTLVVEPVEDPSR